MSRQTCVRLVALALAAMSAQTIGAQGLLLPGTAAPRADEYRVKAAFLFNFAKFVEWPASAFPSQAAPLNVCVLGADPFGDVLEETLKGRSVGGRSIVARRLAEVEPGCHLLFVSGSERRRLAVIAEQLRSESVLTISEDEGFNALGGMIELFTEGESVQFNISPSAVERSGLHASARLIALAANQRHSAGVRR
jgi:hypothetical protein